MKRVSKPAPAAYPARKQAVINARVSSKEQEKEGFSIPAQLKLLREYAAANGFGVAQEYVDVETAKQTGRAAYTVPKTLRSRKSFLNLPCGSYRRASATNSGSRS